MRTPSLFFCGSLLACFCFAAACSDAAVDPDLPNDAGDGDNSSSGGEDTEHDAGRTDSGSRDAGSSACAEGEVRCQGNAVQTCTKDPNGPWQFGEAVHCPDANFCGEGSCRPVPESWAPSTQILRDYAAGLRSKTAAPGVLDFDAIVAGGIDEFYRAASLYAEDPPTDPPATPDGGDAGAPGSGLLRPQFARAFGRGVRFIQNAVPQGHQSVSLTRCGRPNGIAYNSQSDYGVCGASSADDIVITYAQPDNPMGLQVGDRIVSSSEIPAGPEFLDELIKEPGCGSSVLSRENRRGTAAASVFSFTPPGESLHVIAADGSPRDVTIPPRPLTPQGAPDFDKQMYCASVYGDSQISFEIQATLRPDGIAVLRVPHFGPYVTPFPSPLTLASYTQWVSDFVDRLKAGLDTVQGARGYVWDVRSNLGGSQEVALAVAAGAGATPGTIVECKNRIADSEPFAFGDTSITFEIPEDDRLHVEGKVAFLIDNRLYSAGEYLAYAIRNHGTSSTRLFGTTTAGAFGYGGGANTPLGTPARMAYLVDSRRCEDMQGVALEGKGVEPHEVVEPQAVDFAAGRDTALEAAIAWINQP